MTREERQELREYFFTLKATGSIVVSTAPPAPEPPPEASILALKSVTPANLALNQDLDTVIEVEYVESVKFGSGTIEVRDSAGTLVKSYVIGTSTDLVLTGQQPRMGGTWPAGETLRVIVPAGAFKSLDDARTSEALEWVWSTLPDLEFPDVSGLVTEWFIIGDTLTLTY